MIEPGGETPGELGIWLPRAPGAGTFAWWLLVEMRPMTTADPITVWIRSLQDGDRCAVPQLLGHYLRKLVGLARDRLRGRPDLGGYEEDIALSAFKSLVLGAERQRFADLLDRHSLWRLLATMVICKAIDLVRKRTTGRSVEEEVAQVVSQEPPPDQAAELAEEVRSRLARLPDDTFRAIALCKLEGYSNAEIARMQGCVERTVERKLNIIRALWRDGGEAP
jgi:RNA polymerase sigma factor (sigma-70 family)